MMVLPFQPQIFWGFSVNLPMIPFCEWTIQGLPGTLEFTGHYDVVLKSASW